MLAHDHAGSQPPFAAPRRAWEATPDGKVVQVKEGTWLQGRSCRDSVIWVMVERGALSGLFAGGSAARRPETSEDLS